MMPTDTINFLGVSEPVFRVGIFIGAFAIFSFLEAMWPRRPRLQNRSRRWVTNGGMVVVATVLVRGLSLIAPLLAATAATALASNLGWGLFNLTDWPLWLETVIAITLLDFAVWFQHFVSHKVPILWRFHRVHHADRDLDASSALRFHPIEILYSAAYKLGVILVLGPALIAAILFEVILNASAMFNHANLKLPQWMDRSLRSVFVTPDMHRVHHSIQRKEHNTNFGFCLSIWDRLFRTYTPQPEAGHLEMTLGLQEYQVSETKALSWSLWLPVK